MDLREYSARQKRLVDWHYLADHALTAQPETLQSFKDLLTKYQSLLAVSWQEAENAPALEAQIADLERILNDQHEQLRFCRVSPKIGW